MGDGSSPSSLSRAGIWRLISGAASFPTLFSTASGVIGLVAGPPSVPFSRTTEISSEAFQLASTDGCATSLQTRSRHVCEFPAASSPLSAGSATAFDSSFARCHGSRLLTLRLLFVHRSAVSFHIANSSEGFHGSCLDPVSFPALTLTLFRLSALFVWLNPFISGNARVVIPC
jgi:hypothetical protein